MDSPESSQPAGARELRARVRGVLEDEYLRLLTVDRPALLASVTCAVPEDESVVELAAAELEVVDERIGAIHDYLAIVHDAHAGAGMREDSCAVVDFDDGPRLLLLSRIEVADGAVVANDSPLGKSLLGAHPGADDLPTSGRPDAVSGYRCGRRDRRPERPGDRGEHRPAAGHR